VHVALAALTILILSIASSADAKPWFTPPVSAQTGEDASCVVQNLGTKTRTVEMALRLSTGEALLSGSADVAPGEAVGPMSAQGNLLYCTFEGLSRTVRGFIAVRNDDTTYLVLPAAK